MTPMPLLPAQPQVVRSAYRGSDNDAAANGNESDAGATFADLLATGGHTEAGRQPTHPADAQGKHRHEGHKADPDGAPSPDGTPAVTPPPIPVQQATRITSGSAVATGAATGTAVDVVANGSVDPTHPSKLAAASGATALGESSGAKPARGRTTPVSGRTTGAAAPITPAAAQSAVQSTAVPTVPTVPAVPTVPTVPTVGRGHDFGNALGEIGTSTKASGSTSIGSTPAADPALNPLKLQPQAPNEPRDGVTRTGTLDPSTLRVTRFDAGGPSASKFTAGTMAARPAAGHARGTEHSPVIGTVPGPSTANVLSSSGQPAASALAHPQPSAPATTPTAQPQPAAPPQPVHRQVSDALLGVRARGDGTHRLTLELHPADLGQVTVEVRIHAGAVSINLGSVNDEARHSLSQALPQLRAELAEAGLGGASVSVGADSSGGFAAHRDGTPGRPASGSTPESAAQQGSASIADVATPPVGSYPASAGVDRWL